MAHAFSVTVNAKVCQTCIYTCHNFPEAGDLVYDFHLPQKEAAKNRRMPLTKFKALCKSRGIKRWPFRCFNSMHPKRSTNVVTAPVTQPVDECTSLVNSVIDDLNISFDYPPPPHSPEENTNDDLCEAIRKVMLYKISLQSPRRCQHQS